MFATENKSSHEHLHLVNKCMAVSLKGWMETFKNFLWLAKNPTYESSPKIFSHICT